MHTHTHTHTLFTHILHTRSLATLILHIHTHTHFLHSFYTDTPKHTFYSHFTRTCNIHFTHLHTRTHFLHQFYTHKPTHTPTKQIANVLYFTSSEKNICVRWNFGWKEKTAKWEWNTWKKLKIYFGRILRTLRITTLNECHHAECHLCWVSQISPSCWVILCRVSLCWMSWRPFCGPNSPSVCTFECDAFRTQRYVNCGPGDLFKTLYYLPNQWIGPIS